MQQMLVTAVSDADLVALAKQGDRTAFRELVKRHEAKVAGIVRGMLGDVAEAADVGQEVFIRFFKALGEFRGDAAVGTYLGRIAINLSLNALKSRQRHQSRFVTEELAVSNGSREEEQRHEAREIVAKALTLLEPEFRTVIVVRLIEGYSTKEAAEMLDLPQGTVLSRLSRGQEKLKGIIEKLMR
jgi:RNA polymerase sigma-70 factor, ECF subfamily